MPKESMKDELMELIQNKAKTIEDYTVIPSLWQPLDKKGLLHEGGPVMHPGTAGDRCEAREEPQGAERQGEEMMIRTYISVSNTMLDYPKRYVL